MPYYMGDYGQMRGAYEGDPFFGALAGLAKRAIGAVAGKFFRRGAAAPAAAGVATTGIMRRLPPVLAGPAERIGGAIAKHPVISAAGAAGIAGILAGRETAPAGALPRGFHISKKTGKVVRNRRMRVTNPRALRRAIRRANGFARLARRVLHFTSPRGPRGRAIFKKRRRR